MIGLRSDAMLRRIRGLPGRVVTGRIRAPEVVGQVAAPLRAGGMRSPENYLSDIECYFVLEL
jgi:hypothetical protein